jgi:WhiB family redox-sensing transcriptional regulator
VPSKGPHDEHGSSPLVAEEDDMESTWMSEGNCADKPPSLFFPSDGVGVDVARKVCADCPVKSPCLEYALEHRIDHGVWGGTSERERRRILRSRAGRSVEVALAGR